MIDFEVNRRSRERMKKLIILAMVIGFLFMASEAKAAPFIIVPVVGGGAGGVAFAALGIAAVASIIVFSPYFYQFYTHPECQKEPTIGDLSSCVQYGPAKK
jgi:hypothetical protein